MSRHPKTISDDDFPHRDGLRPVSWSCSDFSPLKVDIPLLNHSQSPARCSSNHPTGDYSCIIVILFSTDAASAEGPQCPSVTCCSYTIHAEESIITTKTALTSSAPVRCSSTATSIVPRPALVSDVQRYQNHSLGTVVRWRCRGEQLSRRSATLAVSSERCLVFGTIPSETVDCYAFVQLWPCLTTENPRGATAERRRFPLSLTGVSKTEGGRGGELTKCLTDLPRPFGDIETTWCVGSLDPFVSRRP